MSVPLIRWDAPGPYTVAFSTRQGGVSDGAFESLNLGLLTEDEPQHVEENRRRLCEAVGGEPDRLAMNRQVHAATVNRAEPGMRGNEGDGLWSEEPGLPMLKLTADCLPIALARTNGRPALALLHAGRLGLIAGIVEAGVAALGDAPSRPLSGPASVRVATRSAPTSSRNTARGSARTRSRVATWTSGPSASARLRAAGVDSVERLDLCTACDADRFFSHRRDRGRTGRQGVIGLVA